MPEPVCPLCGDTQMRRTRVLYGRFVCRRCWAAFNTRRQIAWLIDASLVGLLASALAKLAHFPAGPALPFPTEADWPWYAIVSALFALKDGFGGRSVGKAVRRYS